MLLPCDDGPGGRLRSAARAQHKWSPGAMPQAEEDARNLGTQPQSFFET
tara:strand:- start:1396 stop:1542 length:147 start_codon:yes stop_codon:yes gene_type:complete